MTNALRNLIASAVRFLFNTLSYTKIIDGYNVPAQGGCILAMNHLSRLDPAVAYITIDREDMTALVADKYKSTPGISWLVNIFNGIWVNREEVDMKAIRAARDYLRNGGALGIAPEGTRSQTKALIRAKTGVAYLADKAQVPLVPIAIWGSERAFKDLAHFRRAKINIRFGEPFNLEPMDRMDRNGSLLRNTDEIMCRIAAMLPPEYWGEYADHPRLHEMMQANQETRLQSAN